MNVPVWPSVGVELEMPTAHARTGATHPVGPYFGFLQDILAAHGLETHVLQADGRIYGLRSARGVHGLDNGYNNLESSLAPLDGRPTSLAELAAQMRQEVRDVTTALGREEAMLLNFSEHPDVRISLDFYRAVRAPKPIYDYQIFYRGWNHSSGFDAKAHNSPCTGMDFSQAVDALNCLLALSPVFIALFANSPFEGGQARGYKENRLTLWPRQMDCARFPGDHRLHRMPERPFVDLCDYFRWMFGPGTSMWFGAVQGVGKSVAGCCIVGGDPPLLEFLRGGHRWARVWPGGQPRVVHPSLDMLVYHQFTQYSDCRLRYGLREGAHLEEFWAAFDAGADRLTEWFAAQCTYCYVEGRAAGANFVDQELADRAPGACPAVVVAPSALQYGLMRNLRRALAFVTSVPWTTWHGLRESAARHALDGEYAGVRVRALCAQVVEIAGAGLPGECAWMLDYPQWVLRSGETGADRAVRRYERLRATCADPLRRLIVERKALAL